MKTKHSLVIVAALAVPLMAYAQQPQQPPPAPPQAAPCAPSQQPQPPKGTKFDLPKGLKQAFEKQRQQIQNKTGLTIPSADDIKQQVQQAAASSPCPQPVPQTPKPPVPPTPATPASATPVKPVYVCPPKATLIAGYAYCLMPDQSVVDAIPLPQPKQ